MSRFLNKLEKLLAEAENQKVIDSTSGAQLHEIAAEMERGSGVLKLASVLSWIGGATLAFGIILIISANWAEISPTMKLVGFFVLFLGVHFLGIRARINPETANFGEGLNFVGAILLLAGIALVSQIYQIDIRYSKIILFWFLGIAPLAWCFRSALISFLSILAFVFWLHFEQFGNEATNISFASMLVIDMGVGVALLGFSALLRDPEPRIALSFRVGGVFLLFYSVYLFGFYRHLNFLMVETWYKSIVPFIAIVLGGTSLVISYRKMLPDNPLLRNRLVILLGSLLGTAAITLLLEIGLIPKGPDLKFFNFGWYRSFFMMEWIISIAAWFFWFALAFWCVVFASRTGRTAYLNVGVLAFGFGVVTRFFDLMGGLFETGLAFVVGGIVLLATCYGVERWRRTITRQILRSDHQLRETKK